MRMFVDDRGFIAFAEIVEEPITIGRLRGAAGDYLVFRNPWDCKPWGKTPFERRFIPIEKVVTEMNVYAEREGTSWVFAIKVKHEMRVSGKIIPEGDYVIIRGIARLHRTKEEFERKYEPASIVVYREGGEQIGI